LLKDENYTDIFIGSREEEKLMTSMEKRRSEIYGATNIERKFIFNT
jgi:hypothetical protein